MKQVRDYIVSINKTRVHIVSRLERKEVQLFDLHAFEEVWINACLHNKWIRNTPPAVYIFDNKIEIVSSGGLLFDYSLEEFYTHPINSSLQRIIG